MFDYIFLFNNATTTTPGRTADSGAGGKAHCGELLHEKLTEPSDL